MRFHDMWDDVMGTPSKVRVLRLLARYPSREFTGRELAELSRTSPPRAIHALRELARSGLVDGRSVGRATVWKLCSSHLIAPEVRRMFALESSLGPDLLKLVAHRLTRNNVGRAIVFGSTVEGSERPDSDIDLYVEVTSERDKEELKGEFDRLASAVYQRFGRPLSILVYTRAEASRPPNPSLMGKIISHGWVAVGS